MTETATFGAGCFWGVEETFRQTPGVIETSVGYCGGTTEHPTYEDVCTNRTGHAEVVQVTYDPEKVSYETLLKVFFDNHNPTQHNAQGPDIGSQYRSVIFTHSVQQKEAAVQAKAALAASKKWSAPIVTEIADSVPFYRAEDYHQQYLAKRGLSHCHL